MQEVAKPTKRLFIRLSSLGDVVLASSSLWTEKSAHSENHWLTSPEFQSLFEAHPRVQRLWIFSRKQGFRAWLGLIKEFRRQDFDEIIDLHRSLRTTVLVAYFWMSRILSLLGGRKSQRVIRISKERFAQWGFYFFKALWPKAFRPTPWVKRFALAGGGAGTERPSFKHLVDLRIQLQQRTGIAVMPASAWSGKLWQTDQWVRLLESWQARSPNDSVAILGTITDEASVSLLQAAAQNPQLKVQDQVGKASLTVLCSLLAEKKVLLCVDTGLGHLAESVGTPVVMAFGPTHPDLGFRPWMEKSGCAQSSLWCRPCSKDGTKCFRIVDRFRCMKEVNLEDFTRGLDH